MSAHLAHFSSTIRSASEADLRSDVTLGGALALSRAEGIVVSYAPFEHIQRGARVVIVGITPGAQQAGNALVELRRRLIAGDTDEAALAAAKVFASFSGPMRTNLVAMLDHIGLPRWLGVSSTAALWSSHQELVHFTSALRYPVFVGGANYNGQPGMISSPTLRRLLDECLREEAEALSGAVWIPLGPKAATGVQHIVKSGALNAARVLDGLPHPSGANAERIAYFIGRKSREALSTKTDPVSLDLAKARLMALARDCPRATGQLSALTRRSSSARTGGGRRLAKTPRRQREARWKMGGHESPPPDFAATLILGRRRNRRLY